MKRLYKTFKYFKFNLKAGKSPRNPDYLVHDGVVVKPSVEECWTVEIVGDDVE